MASTNTINKHDWFTIIIHNYLLRYQIQAIGTQTLFSRNIYTIALLCLSIQRAPKVTVHTEVIIMVFQFQNANQITVCVIHTILITNNVKSTDVQVNERNTNICKNLHETH